MIPRPVLALRGRRRGAALVAAGAAALAGMSGGPTAHAAFTPPPIHHVFLIELENKGFAETFQTNPNHYLAKSLPAAGVMIPNYFGTGHFSLDNYIAQVSGQPPNPVTQSDCQVFQDFVGAVAPVSAGPAAPGVAVGQGCVLPASVPMIGDQLTAAGLPWKGYMQDMQVNSHGYGTTCAHPAVNSQDMSQSASATDQYAVRHDPFVYFHSLIDNPAACSAHVVPLTGLTTDLASTSTTPAFSWITPNLCDDGHDATCAGKNSAGTNAGGLVSIDAFLQAYVPRIVNSPAFQQDGMLVISFDEAETTDASACCGEANGPNTVNNGGPTAVGNGGGQMGMVIISKYIAPGTKTMTAYNHYSLLRSLEDVLGIHTGGADGAGHLALAAQATAFGPDVYTRAAGLPSGTVFAEPTRVAASSTGLGGVPNTGSGGGAAGPALLLAGGALLVAGRRRRRAQPSGGPR